MRQTINFENNKPLLLVEENHNMLYSLGFYSGYLMNKYDCDGSF